MAGSHGREGPGVAIGPPEHRRRLVVPDDPLGPRVPPQRLPAEAHGDVAEVADGDRPVGDLDGGGGRLAREDAIDEVAEVVVALVEVDLPGADLSAGE